MTTTPISSSMPGATSTMSTTPAAAAKTASGGTSSLGSDAFLKLLVAQLKYQDPMSPAKGTDFMAQTAQFTMVEKLTEMAKQNASALAGQQTLQATAMVGHQVAYIDSIGNSVKGVVTSVKLLPAGPSLMISGQEVAMTAVTDVGPTTTTPAAGAAAPTSASTTTQQLLQATELVGHQVSYADALGASSTGVVSSVKLLPSGLTLVIGGRDVPAGAVTQIQQLSSASTPSAESLIAMLGPTIAAALAAAHVPASTTPASTTPAST
ncbi:MAG: hypothetical protein ORN20_08855, partial [Candidatus Nanopelagicales bacterium]|nr:hypothetical protein [Candidatus Nanopelagicales bacterium]